MRFSSFFLAASVLIALPALAQNDTRGLIDRLDRIERDLNSLQTQVYRNQGARAPSSSAASSGAAADASVSGGAYAMLDDRINKIEEQQRGLTDQLEKLQITLNQLTAKLERNMQDSEFRMKQLEDKASNAAPPPAAPAPAPANADQGGLAPASGFLTHPGDKPQAGGSALPAGKPASEQYDYAFGLLRGNDYDGATRSFQAFLKEHPSDPLAGNAAYWIGQIDFAQGHYDQAAVTFLDAYQKYPKSAKASEALLGVGLSMGNLGKKKEACAALRRFQTEYPDASDSLKRKATAERAKQGC